MKCFLYLKIGKNNIPEEVACLLIEMLKELGSTKLIMFDMTVSSLGHLFFIAWFTDFYAETVGLVVVKKQILDSIRTGEDLLKIVFSKQT